MFTLRWVPFADLPPRKLLAVVQAEVESSAWIQMSVEINVVSQQCFRCQLNLCKVKATLRFVFTLK